MLFEATTGKTPFHDGSRFMEPQEVMMRVCMALRPRARKQGLRLPWSLEELIDCLLSRPRDERPLSAIIVARELERIETEIAAAE